MAFCKQCGKTVQITRGYDLNSSKCLKCIKSEVQREELDRVPSG